MGERASESRWTETGREQRVGGTYPQPRLGTLGVAVTPPTPLITVAQSPRDALAATRTTGRGMAPRIIGISRNSKGIKWSFGLPSFRTTLADVHSITFEHRYLLCRTFPSPSRLPPPFLSLSLSLFFSRFPALALTPSLPITGAPASLSLSHSYPLYTRECTPEARFKDRHASTFSYANVHFGGPATDTASTPSFGLFCASRIPVFRSFFLSLSLLQIHSSLPSRSRSLLHSALLRGRRLSMSRDIEREKERDGRRENSRNVKSVS